MDKAQWVRLYICIDGEDGKVRFMFFNDHFQIITENYWLNEASIASWKEIIEGRDTVIYNGKGRLVSSQKGFITFWNNNKSYMLIYCKDAFEQLYYYLSTSIELSTSQ
jgi:hypothetical protein